MLHETLHGVPPKGLGQIFGGDAGLSVLQLGQQGYRNQLLLLLL